MRDHYGAGGLALTLLLTIACRPSEQATVIFPPGGMAIDSTGRQERIWTRDTLVLLRRVGGASDGDTTLLNPYIMTMDADQVYLVEPDGRILCFDTLGHKRWVQGKSGAGPGEYRNPRDLKVAPDGRLWVLDPENGRLTILSREHGKVLGMRLLKVGHSEALTTLKTGFAVYPPDQQGDIHYFSEMGDPVRVDSLRWDGYRQLESLARQHRTAVDRHSGRWAFGLIYGNGWFAFDSSGQGSGRRYYVEPTGFPAVERVVHGNTIQTSLIRSPASALDLYVASDTLFVLFDGAEPLRRRKVDMYDVQTGKYYGSFQLPEPSDNIGVSGNLLAVLATNPVPHLTFYRRQGKVETAAR